MCRLQSLEHLIEGNPILWTHVSGLDPLQHIEKALRLSKPLPITVVYLRDYNNQLLESEFTAVVNPHVTRWGRASFRYDDLDKNPQAWESSELPKLHNLYIDSYSEDHRRVPILLGGGRELPNLQAVDLTDTPLRWDPGQLPGLRVLKLSGYVNIGDTSLLLQLLTGTPRLERLSLVEVSMWVDSAFQLSVTLPHLINIDLQTVPAKAMQHLLSSIQLPQYDGNRMDHNGVDHLPSEECSDIPSKPPHNGSRFDLLKIDESEINLSKGIFTLSASVGLGPDVWLLKSVEIVLRRFAKQLTASQIIRAEILISRDDENSPVPKILDKLDRFPSVRAIKINGSSKKDPLIQLLTWPKILADRVVWHLPHLETILFTMQDPPFSELGEMCRERRGAALRSGSPKAIKELRISPKGAWLGPQYNRFDHTPEEELDKLQDALGGGQLYWGSELWKGRLDRQLTESTSSSLE